MLGILSDRKIIEVKGVDAEQFLQSLVTNDVKQDSKLIYSWMLTAQGKYFADFFIYKVSNEHFYIDIDENYIEDFVKKIKLYKLRLKVTIQLTELYVLAGFDLLNADIGGQDPRLAKLGYRYITDNKIADITQQYKNLRYELAIPETENFIKEKSFPLEYGMQQLNAVSFNKGCYVGQEVVSRTYHLGEVRKRIFQIKADKDLENIEIGSNIMSESTKIGVLLGVNKNRGLALIRLPNYEQNHHNLHIDNIQIELSQPEYYS